MSPVSVTKPGGVHEDKRYVEDEEARACWMCLSSVERLEVDRERAATEFLELDAKKRERLFEEIARSHNALTLYLVMGGTEMELDSKAWAFYRAFGTWHDARYPGGRPRRAVLESLSRMDYYLSYLSVSDEYNNTVVKKLKCVYCVGCVYML
ncbi:hypothetical protein PsorP6_009746 [Peronosclerospora sorghi]|uniref:Uncharacterized protein n=1 Tax=Peronosclerospora sorghi TaxID=230839 RepID=A0ACC0VYA4_9STRA|nr:hypothetical protein PsorP6_009746 [Peronosclerospora sorghi]